MCKAASHLSQAPLRLISLRLALMSLTLWSLAPLGLASLKSAIPRLDPLSEKKLHSLVRYLKVLLQICYCIVLHPMESRAFPGLISLACSFDCQQVFHTPYVKNSLVNDCLYVCTFGKEGSRKGHHVVSRRNENLETMEVSDASTYCMPG
jgi:hypothetical protein